jgi:BolA protein
VSTDRAHTITRRLREHLDATHVEVIDDSARHAGHPGAASGAGHFRVLVVSERFEGLQRVAKQRLVYRVLADLMDDEIHALQMQTLTPDEWQRLRGG